MFEIWDWGVDVMSMPRPRRQARTRTKNCVVVLASGTGTTHSFSLNLHFTPPCFPGLFLFIPATVIVFCLVCGWGSCYYFKATLLLFPFPSSFLIPPDTVRSFFGGRQSSRRIITMTTHWRALEGLSANITFRSGLGTIHLSLLLRLS
jgi:hypothetical protein